LTDAGAGYEAFWRRRASTVNPFLDSAAGSTVNLPIADGLDVEEHEINKAANDLYLDKTDVASIAQAMDKIGNEK